MGNFAGSCFAGLAFGCFNCCLKELGTCCGGLIGRERLAKFLYVLLDILVVVPAIVIFYYLQSWEWFVNYFSKWIHCPAESGGNLNCFGSSAVYRLSMALLLLYILLLLVMMCRNRLSKVVNQGLFLIKYFLVVGGFIGLLFVQNQIFINYALVCKTVGLVFLVLQSIILIDLFYLWGISWFRKFNQGRRQYGVHLIIFSVIMYAGAFALNVFSYINFRDCVFWPSIITSVLLVVIPATQLLNFNIQNSLLTTSVLCLYLSYLNFISLYSKPQCHALNAPAMAADISTSCILFFVAMFGSVMGGSGVIKTSSDNSLNDALGLASQQQKPAQSDELLPHIPQQNSIPVSDDNSYNGWSWVKWHIYMCIGSMYIAMMITNWGSPQVNDPIIGAYRANQFSYWSRQGLQWVTGLLYIWTLVAPRLFPDRNFIIE